MSNYLKLLSVSSHTSDAETVFNEGLRVATNYYESRSYWSRAISKDTAVRNLCVKIALIEDSAPETAAADKTYRVLVAANTEDLENYDNADPAINYSTYNITHSSYGNDNYTVNGFSNYTDSGDVRYTYYGSWIAKEGLNNGIPRFDKASGESFEDIALRVANLMDDGSWTNAPDTPSDLNDKTSEEEGYGDTGDHDHTSDTIGIPDEPSLGVTTAGFIRAYNPTQAQLNDLGVVLFPPSPTQATDTIEAILAVAAGLYNSKLIDYVVDVHVIPVTPQVGGAENIFCGNVNTEVAANRVTSDYVDFSCGSINVGECYGNYIDYMTRGRLFLPFVGFVDLKPEYWQSGTLSVDYRFNIVDGSFMAFVRSTSSKSQLSDTVIGQYGGNCCTHFPLTGLNYSSMLSGLITGSMQLAAAVGAGSPVGVATSAATMLNQKPSVSQSNNYNASTSFLGVRRPYLLLERPVPNFAAYYNHDRGLPLNVTYQLSDLSGFTIIPEIDLSSLSCTEKEKAELTRLFAEGVYF